MTVKDFLSVTTDYDYFDIQIREAGSCDILLECDSESKKLEPFYDKKIMEISFKTSSVRLYIMK